MKTLYENRFAWPAPQSDRMLPPSGGLLVALGISALFWGALAWLII